MYDMEGYITELNYDGKIVLFIGIANGELLYQGTFDSFEDLERYIEENDE